jgi:uncharacterized protein (DUF58 family)
MDAAEIVKKVRKIEIKTRGLSNQIFSGEYHSVFKGRGMSFSEVREYQYGDDIRSIDWNVTARMNHPYIKIFEEERELTVMLLIDVSGSNDFGSGNQLKAEMITEIAAVLAFSAIQNNDKVGVIFFSDKIEKFIPPKKGTTHILRIIRELIDFRRTSNKTEIAEALKYFTNVVKKKCTAFLISDFFDENYEDALKITNRKHDLIAIQAFDHVERELPKAGLVRMRDAETEKRMWIDTSSTAVRRHLSEYFTRFDKNLHEILKRCGVDFATVCTNQDYVRPLMNLFKKREGRA